MHKRLLLLQIFNNNLTTLLTLSSTWRFQCIRMLTWHQREEASRVGRTESELTALNEICLESTQLLLCTRESVLGIAVHWNEKRLAAFIRQRKDRTPSTKCAIWEITDQIIHKESNSLNWTWLLCRLFCIFYVHFLFSNCVYLETHFCLIHSEGNANFNYNLLCILENTLFGRNFVFKLLYLRFFFSILGLAG